MAEQYAAFLAKFDAQAKDGRLDKATCVRLAAECILKVSARGRTAEREEMASDHDR